MDTALVSRKHMAHDTRGKPCAGTSTSKVENSLPHHHQLVDSVSVSIPAAVLQELLVSGVSSILCLGVNCPADAGRLETKSRAGSPSALWLARILRDGLMVCTEITQAPCKHLHPSSGSPWGYAWP